MGKLLTFRIFIKSVTDQTNLKLGVMITWVNSIIKKKNIIAIATCLDDIDFLNHGPCPCCLNFHVMNQIEATRL